MMSLIEQLRRLATPVAASYAPDSVHRKSLVYEDPSKVDTLLCYQESLAGFDKMCKIDEIFLPFRQTIFAETSCRLEMCTLFPEEKSKLDAEIQRILCFASPFLKQYDAIRMLEWLVHKFQIHQYYVEDLIRCVMPYHETGLFAKFLQLIDFSTVSAEFRWLKPYAQSGKCLSRKELVRACLHESSVVPFISSLMINSLKLCKGLSDPSRLNDLTNFFLTTVVALCDAGLADDRLAKILDSFQYVLRTGLRAVDCPPFQSATCLIVIRFSQKLSLNPDLVLIWIECLLKKTRPSQTWESLRVIAQLMRNQHIATLPAKLASRHVALLSTLPESQQKVIEQEQERLIDQIDVNELANQAASSSAEVQSTILTMSIPTLSKDMAPITYAANATSTKRTYSDSELLSICEKEVHLAHAILAALPENIRCCLFQEQDSSCTCPKLDACQRSNKSWLSDLLLTGVLCNPLTNGKLNKLEVRRARRVFQFAELAVKAHLKATVSPSSAPRTRSSGSPRQSRLSLSKVQCLLEDGLDHSLPLLLACLVHRSSSLRLSAFNLLRSWISGLLKSQWTPSAPDCPRISRLFQAMAFDPSDSSASTDRFSLICSNEVAELLRGDSLPKLDNAAPTLVSLCICLLLSEPLPRPGSPQPVSAYASACWANGLPLLNDKTVGHLFSVHNVDKSDHVSGWSAFLALVRSSASAYSVLHSLSISVLNADLFHALQSFPRSAAHSSSLNQISPITDPSVISDSQSQLLDSLCYLAQHDPANYASVATMLDALSLDLPHFDYILLKLDASRNETGSGQRSLFARVNEKRETRRRSTKQSMPLEMNTTGLESDCVLLQTNRSRLQLLSTLLPILTESVSRLQCTSTTTIVEETEKTLNITKVPQKSPSREGSILPLCELITPLVNHLIWLLSQEQRAVQLKHNDVPSSSSDSESESETDRNKRPHIGPLAMNSDTEPTDISLAETDSLDFPHSLLRQCCYRVLVCLTAISAEANRRKPRTKRRAIRISHGNALTSPGVHVTASESAGSLISLIQAAVNPVFQCLSVFPDWHALHQQVLLCIIELTNLCPAVLSQRLINLVQWTANNKQFMRLDNVHTLALLGRLVVIAVPALIRSSTNQTKAGLEVLLLFVDGMPGLASRLPRRRLAFYTGLVRGLAQVTGPLCLDYDAISQPSTPRSAVKTDPKLKKLERQRQREWFARCQENWVGSWLWTISLVFLNRNWVDESTADQVVPLLIDLHGQFTWDTQVSAWYECLAFLAWLDKNAIESIPLDNKQSVWSKRALTETPIKKPELVDTQIVPPVKRRRTSASGSQSDNPEPTEPEKHELVFTTNFTSPRITQSLLSVLFHSESELDLSSSSTAPVLTPASTWSLTGRAVQLLTTLLSDPIYAQKIQQAAGDPLGLGAVYGRLVEQSVQLMLCAAAALARCKSTSSKTPSTDDLESMLNEGAKQTLSGLQKVLIQIHDSVSGSIFVRMVSDLFDSVNRGLRHKALELLAAKLTSLVANCQPSPILDTTDPNALKQKLRPSKIPKRSTETPLDLVLEAGLVQFTAQLASQYKLPNLDSAAAGKEMHDAKEISGLFSSSFSRQSLACLRDLARLLCDRYPGEFSRTMDILISNPTAWWPVLPTNGSPRKTDSNKISEVRGSGSAESRSLVCLFFVECLQRLPRQSICPEASATTHRLRHLVHFALDHVITSCQLSSVPSLTLSSLASTSTPDLVVGLVHSRDQHLQAGLTLLSNLMELAIVHGQLQSRTLVSASTIASTSGSRTPWLNLEEPQSSQSDNLPASFQLPVFIFRLSQLDVAAATGANPERSSSTLRQVHELSNRIRKLLSHIADVRSTLSYVNCITRWAQTNTDWTVLRGCLLFVREFAESIGFAVKPGPGELSCTHLKPHLIQHGETQPDHLHSVVVSLLEACELAAEVLSDPIPMQTDLHASVSALFAILPLDTMLRFLQRLLEWTIAPVVARETVHRLTTYFHIIANIIKRLTAEDFSEISHQISLVDYLVVAFAIVVGQKRKTVRKLAVRLHLKDCLDLYSNGTESDGLALAEAALLCAQRWLNAEHESNTCLDVASSGGSVLEFPTGFVALLETNPARVDSTSALAQSPLLTETQLGLTLDAFIQASAGDEALLRPMGCALASKILHSTHWRARLTAIRLLKRAFDRLISGDQMDPGSAQHTGIASCLVADTLAALSEALEDDQPEVEAEANRLFAELEQSGLTGASRRTTV